MREVGAIQLTERARADLLDAAPDAILVVDNKGLLVLVNAQAERLFGYRREQLIGTPVEPLVSLADPRFHPYSTRFQQPGRRRDGTEFPASISVSTMVCDGGLLTSATIRDVTERIEAEAELIREKTVAERVRLEAEVDRITAEGEKTVAERVRLEAEDSRGRLEAQLHQSQRMESLGQLAGGVAHDFNNLLAVILNYAAFVAEELTSAAATPTGMRWAEPLKDVEQIQLAAERASLLTHQLLAFARREVVQPRELNLNGAIIAMEQILRRTLGEQIELVINLPDSLPMIMADSGQIEQVILNLAINARDAMVSGGTLTIDTSVRAITENDNSLAGAPPGPYVCFRVRDTGVGMSAEVRDRAFEPFFTTKPRGEGSGLGLATVYGIVSQSGGYSRIY
ncbi:MAG: PAS domain S-box protein, partial [Actinomycetota bacterium]|nr:PAS domain S-box protein [Actinomycetota bacterium]